MRWVHSNIFLTSFLEAALYDRILSDRCCIAMLYSGVFVRAHINDKVLRSNNNKFIADQKGKKPEKVEVKCER